MCMCSYLCGIFHYNFSVILTMMFWQMCLLASLKLRVNLSSTLPEIDPDTAYVVCISVSLGFFLYGIRIPLFSSYGIHMPLFPYMVIPPIVLGVALLRAAMDSPLSQGPLLWRHNDMTVIVSPDTRGRERDTRQRLDNANARRLQTFNR